MDPNQNPGGGMPPADPNAPMTPPAAPGDGGMGQPMTPPMPEAPATEVPAPEAPAEQTPTTPSPDMGGGQGGNMGGNPM